LSLAAHVYQNQHTLLVPLLADLLLVGLSAGQGLVNGSHSDIRELMLCCRSEAQLLNFCDFENF
jgi:hypothetical protein